MTEIANNGLDIQAIHPGCGAKFSPNLYQWLTAKRSVRMAVVARVYLDDKNSLWIGRLNGRELIGSQLFAVLCNGAQEKIAAWQNVQAVELPDFWALYMAQGRCAADPLHQMYFMSDETRWETNGDSRSCLWCGKVNQTLKRWTEVVQKERWQ